jgi:Mg-chelatase subunit ChlD
VALLFVGAAPTEQDSVWLDVALPAHGALEVGPIGLAEVSGRAGSGGVAGHDVVIAIDVSGSTAAAAGADVDGDGSIGRASSRAREAWRNFNPRWLSSDPGDTILAAELAAAQRLTELLDLARTRVGVVTFSGSAELVAPLGSDRSELAAALAELEGTFGSGSTNLGDALRLATDLLRDSPANAGAPRVRSLLVLSDGYPTEPPPESAAAEAALAAARAATTVGVRIHSFALGMSEIREGDVFERIASVSGGRLARVAQPAEIVHELPRVDLARVAEVRAENRTSGQSARAVRVFPDGSFDGFVALVPGDNAIAITARGPDGAERTLERVVRFERRAPAGAAEAERIAARLAALLRRLRDRSVETALETEIEAQRRASRELAVEAEPGPEGR